MPNNYMYIFKCKYGNRVKERQFIKDILKNFDKDYATMVGAIVNNNPYCLEFSVAVNLQDDPVVFDDWLKKNYPEKFKYHNIFLSDITKYNVQSFTNETMVDMALVSEGNGFLFFWPEQELLESRNPQYKCLNRNESKVFISHSSKDKKNIVNPLNSYLQAESVATWLDSAEIDYGDNIYLKVNEGIENSDVGVFILTDNFFDNKSGWPTTEFSVFFMEMMKSEKNILLINAGVSPENIHAMMKPYKYLEWTGLESLPEIAEAIRRKINT